MSREEKREREGGLGVLGLIALMAVAVRSAVNPKRKTILDASDTDEIRTRLGYDMTSYPRTIQTM